MIGGLSYGITSVDVQLDSNGEPLKATGSIEVSQDDLCVAGQGVATFQADVVKDTVLPSFAPYPETPRFAWNGIILVGSEPMLDTDVMAAAQLDAASCQLSWSLVDYGTPWIKGFAKDWDALAGKSLTFSLLPGVHDLSCNAGSAQSFETTFVDPGPAAAQHALDSANTLYSWGNVQYLAAGDPKCEEGGCLKIDATWPSTTSTGAAAQVLATAGATKVKVRWRLVSPQGVTWSGWRWDLMSDYDPLDSFSNGEGHALLPTGNGAETATAWSWREASWPKNATRVAVELRPDSFSSGGCGKSVELLIDRIVTE